MPASEFERNLAQRLDTAVAHYSAFAESWLEAVAQVGSPPISRAECGPYIEELVRAFDHSRGAREIGYPHALVLEPLVGALARRALSPLLSWFKTLSTSPTAIHGENGALVELMSSVSSIDCQAVGLSIAEIQNQLLKAVSDYLSASQRCEQYSSAAVTEACSMLSERLQEDCKDPSWEPTDVRAAYRLWLDCFDSSYCQLVREQDYPAAFGARLNAASSIARAVKRWAGLFPASISNPRPDQDPAPSSPAECGIPAAPRNGSVKGQSSHVAARELARFRRKAEHRRQHLCRSPVSGDAVRQREMVWTDQGIRLYHYRHHRLSATPRPPLLIVYAMVNRPSLLDLQPDRSLVRGLLEQDMDVYLLDWGDPGTEREHCGLAEHVLVHMDACVRRVSEICGQPQINLLGVCQGGVLALSYTSLRPERIGRLVTMVTPVDFEAEGNTLGWLARDVDFLQLVDATGNLPGGLLNSLFLSLSPVRLGIRKYFDLIENSKPQKALEDFMRMESWIFDSPDQPGSAFAEFACSFIQGNGLMRGTLTLGDETVDLRNIECPVLNVYATKDHLVPPASAQVLRSLVGTTDYREYGFSGGHIGIYVSRQAQGRVAATLAKWLRGDSQERAD